MRNILSPDIALLFALFEIWFLNYRLVPSSVTRFSSKHSKPIRFEMFQSKYFLWNPQMQFPNFFSLEIQFVKAK